MSFYVYFIQSKRKGNQPVKIGYSKNPDERLKKLQTANWEELKISVLLPFETEDLAREAEKTFQWLASKKHQSLMGEWFIVRGSWKKFISECMALFDGNQRSKT
jgi:hypothetical protein